MKTHISQCGREAASGTVWITSAINTAVTCMFAGLLSLAAFLATGTPVRAAEPSAQPAAVVENPLGGDLLTFLGPLTDQQARNVKKSDDMCLIKVNRRVLAGHGRSPRDFYMLAKRINPLEGDMLADAQDGEWNVMDQFRAALVAEGNRTPQVVAKYEARMDRIVEDIRQRVAVANVSADEGAVATTKIIFNYLHEKVFTDKYDLDCTDPAQVLETGKYNCVSATLLFNVVAERMGLEACGLEMPGHALSRVKFETAAGRESMDLETTAPNWFSLPDSQARRAATQAKIANPAPQTAAPSPGADFTKLLREITPVQLIATVYYNQGVDYLAAKKYRQAAVANLKALYLDPENETAWGNLMATINNWAIDCASAPAPQFHLAAELLDYGVSLDESYDKFRLNQRHIYYLWIRSLVLEDRPEDAMTVYRFAEKRLPNDPELAKALKK